MNEAELNAYGIQWSGRLPHDWREHYEQSHRVIGDLSSCQSYWCRCGYCIPGPEAGVGVEPRGCGIRRPCDCGAARLRQVEQMQNIEELKESVANLTEALNANQARDKLLVDLLERVRIMAEKGDVGGIQQAIIGSSTVKCRKCGRIVSEHDTMVGGCWACRRK